MVGIEVARMVSSSAPMKTQSCGGVNEAGARAEEVKFNYVEADKNSVETQLCTNGGHIFYLHRLDEVRNNGTWRFLDWHNRARIWPSHRDVFRNSHGLRERRGREQRVREWLQVWHINMR